MKMFLAALLLTLALGAVAPATASSPDCCAQSASCCAVSESCCP